jgi:hypothetical protein
MGAMLCLVAALFHASTAEYWFRLKQVLAKGRFISRRDSMTHSLLERINAAHKGFPGKAAAG